MTTCSRRDHHGHQQAAVGKIDVDVAEVTFKSLARVVGQRDKCLAVIASMLADVAPNLIVAPGVGVLVA